MEDDGTILSPEEMREAAETLTLLELVDSDDRWRELTARSADLKRDNARLQVRMNDLMRQNADLTSMVKSLQTKLRRLERA
jgi:FtsZ-binding cell division protein ZapB